jgi:hypothetical protein
MKQSLFLFFTLLCIYTLPHATTLSGVYQTPLTNTHHTTKPTTTHHAHDEWLDFDDEEEEMPTKPKTRWERFMGGVDKFALQMKALWAFKIKPWWKEKHGKEITIATASTLAALVATWMMYRKYRQQTNFLAHLKITNARTNRVDLTNSSPANSSFNNK